MTNAAETRASKPARKKVQVRTSTGHRGGIVFARGSLFHLLKNRIYLGEIVHKGTSYPGEHEATVPRELWDAVQQRLAERARVRILGNGADHPSLLAGIIRDGEGRPMSPSHANKWPKRYRYYVTHEAHVTNQQPAWRVAAHDLETIVADQVLRLLADPAASVSVLDQHRGDADNRVDRVGKAREQLAVDIATERRQVLLDFVTMVELHDDHVSITLTDRDAVADSNDGPPGELTVAAVRIRRDHDIRLVVAAPAAIVPRLVQLVADAVATRDRLQAMGDVSIAKAAVWFGCCRSTLTDRIKHSYLAPDIIEAILAGRQPRTLTRRRLAAIDLPIDWRQQRQMLGFV